MNTNSVVSFARNTKAKAGALVATVTASLLPLAVMAQTATPVEQVEQKITSAGADGAKIAVAVVLALWGITAIYMLRRKG
ncbi:hypothetical protein ACFPOA_08525 [Lysobacter niabensis]|uniref:hypothetical protein n=1 Tax=Agrilutibacter niabensis TaxID=380628 RepID=UPI003608C439